MAKQSAFAKAVNREVNKQIAEYTRARMQIAQDAAFIAANEVLQLGGYIKRARRCRRRTKNGIRRYRGT